MKKWALFTALFATKLAFATTTCPSLTTVKSIGMEMREAGQSTIDRNIDGIDWHISGRPNDDLNKIVFLFAMLNSNFDISGPNNAANCLYNSFYFETLTKGVGIPLSRTYWGHPKQAPKDVYVCALKDPVGGASSATSPEQCAFEIN